MLLELDTSTAQRENELPAMCRVQKGEIGLDKHVYLICQMRRYHNNQQGSFYFP